MAMTVNTNVMSLNAQRNLSTSQGLLATSLQRLSSGLRINSAKDDAAGLAIAERFTTQIRGLNQAVRNANDGISLSQTAESAMDEVVNNLQRIRELAVQSANATNSDADRAALDAEVQQRLAEIDRIATQTTFNGRRVLDGSFGTAVFQVGANVGETIAVSLNTGVRISQVGQIANEAGTEVTSAALTEGGLTLQIGTGTTVVVGASVDGALAGQEADSAYAKKVALDGAGVSGLTVTATNSQQSDFADVQAADYDLSINGIAIYSDYDATVDGDLTAADVMNAINGQADETGVRAEIDAGSGDLVLTAADGRNIEIDQNATAGEGFQGTIGGTDFSSGGAQNGVGRGTLTLSASDNITLGGNDEAVLGFTDGQVIAIDDTTLANVDILTVDAANDTILRIDASLTAVSSVRSDLGAIQNRFESTIANLSTVVENLEASRSRIQDADFAAETANLTKAQILQQAGVAVLSQANASPQAVLGLLQ
jgi:flagellin